MYFYLKKPTQDNIKFIKMQITARLVQLLTLQTGVSKNGEWKKQDIIVETDGQYPKKICVAIWGDKIQSSQLKTGNKLTIDFDLESREFNGRWYTDVKAWKIETADAANNATLPPVTNDYGFPEPPPLPAEEQNDLPF